MSRNLIISDTLLKAEARNVPFYFDNIQLLSGVSHSAFNSSADTFLKISFVDA